MRPTAAYVFGKANMSARLAPNASGAIAARSPDLLFRALGESVRVRIVNLLGAGELCVCDIVDLLGLPQPTVSRHLRILRDSGLVHVRRRGRYAHYRLSEPRTRLEQSLLRCVRRDLTAARLSTERARAAARVAERREVPC